MRGRKLESKFCVGLGAPYEKKGRTGHVSITYKFRLYMGSYT